jgi:integrin beta 3
MDGLIELSDSLVESVRRCVERATNPLLAKIAELEKQIAAIPAGPKGDPGERGENGERGADGANGKDGTNGQDGAPGINGKDGRDGVDGKDFDPAEMHEAIAKAVASIPPAKDGINGKDGENGRDGRDGLPGVPGINGKDGANGQDGFGLEDFDIEMGEDQRTLTVRFVRGDVRIEKQVKVATVLDTGVYKADQQYGKGDGVSWGGSFWIAQKDTTDKPGHSPDWRLAVKRGNDGKDAAVEKAPGQVRLK